MIESNLEKQFKLFEKNCGGTLGVDALHLENGKIVKYKADETFLMCSTYKIPMAICLLQHIENGSLKLDDYLKITEFDLRPGVTGTLNQLDYTVPVKMSVENLLRFMLQESCNTSTDLLLRHIGGPLEVMKFLERSDIKNMRVDRSILEIISQWDGVQLPANHQMTLKQYNELELKVSPHDSSKAKNKFKNGVEDTATPAAMTSLIRKLFMNELLSKTHTKLLLDIMIGCKRGLLRLLGLLPEGTTVAHKTGTLTGYTCDVGVITLPHDAGHFVVSVYIKDSIKDLRNNERMIAEVGRTLYDYYLL